MSYNFDPELAGLVDLVPAGTLDLTQPEETRARFSDMIEEVNADLDRGGVVTEDRDIPGTTDGASDGPPIPLRIYTPEEAPAEAAPGILHIHGGGFVVGNLDSELGTCLVLCRELGAVVVSVDYRLAPETPFPGALDDCYTALEWIHDNCSALNIDPTRVAVHGMSAGGGLAAALSLLARDRGGPAICFQFLGIPELDDRLNTTSMREFVDTPMWNRHNSELSWDAYLGERYRRGAEDVPYLAAPARAADLYGLPPAYISTMEFDPLRDEGIDYARGLLRAGIRTELHSFPGTFHGSSLFTHAQVSRREAQEQLAVLHRALKIDQ